MSALAAIWACLHSFLYGFHISALNGVQDAITCPDRLEIGSKAGLRECLDIQETQFGLAVSVLTLGGLLGSLLADSATRRIGRVSTLRLAEIGFTLGAALVGLSNGLATIVVGRILIGISAGFVLVTIPLLLAVLSPPKYKTMFGTFHQMSIGVGMIVAQSLSIPFGRVWVWRYVLLVGVMVALGLFLFGLAVGTEKKEEEDRKEDGDEESGADEETPLVRNEESEQSMSVKDLFASNDSRIKRGLLVVAVAQMSQQLCGISPVMYFSTHIFEPIFRAQSKYIALMVMSIGIPFNFVPGLLPERIGSHRIMLVSAAGLALSTILLGISLNAHHQILSAVSVFAFVISFSIGLAPLPWVVLSEIMPLQARTSVGSVAVSVNWLTNFLAGSTFLPLQEALKHGESGEGNIFFVFTGLCCVAFVSIWGSYRFFDRAQA